jgi:alkanesulfonate monooxygenase SsuD/methylene tetrahydromethanopterin reductase-like flavin-dependent oxidoreductase (luciferase family)
MKVSMLCGVSYEGAEAHMYDGWPCPPTLFDPHIGERTFDHNLDYARLADELGFDWISVSEHHYSPHILAPSVAPLAGALTQVARRAKIALLGPLAPVTNPVRIAEEIAMLDQLSHGRLIVLPLRGTPNEYNCYGTISSEKSRAITQEATQLIQKALSDPQQFAWAGEHFQFPIVAIWPRTVQQPFPPMYYSGNNLESARYAGAQHLGMCTSFLPPPVVAETVAAYRAEAGAAGWQPTLDQIVHRNHIVVAETAADAAALEANFMPAHRRKVMANNMKANRGATEAVVMEEWAARFEGGKLLFAGTPDMIVEQIEAFHAHTGVGVLDLIFGSGLLAPAAVRRSIELFGQEVLPRIRPMGQSLSTPQPVAVGQGAGA